MLGGLPGSASGSASSSSSPASSDILFVATTSSVMAYDIDRNAELFFREFPDGASRVIFGGPPRCEESPADTPLPLDSPPDTPRWTPAMSKGQQFPSWVVTVGLSPSAVPCDGLSPLLWEEPRGLILPEAPGTARRFALRFPTA